MIIATRNNLIQLKERLSSWQKNAFEKSYQFKIENGISLIKKNLLEQKNKS